jgi:hypothetical protein
MMPRWMQRECDELEAWAAAQNLPDGPITRPRDVLDLQAKQTKEDRVLLEMSDWITRLPEVNRER